MIDLNTVDKTLQVVLGGAVATTELPITVYWEEVGGVNDPYNELRAANLVTTGATPVEVVPAPKAKYDHVIKSLIVYNEDTAPVTITVQVDDNGTPYILASFTIPSGYTLSYTSEAGWQVLNNAGALRTIEAAEVTENTVAKLATVAGIDATAIADTALYTVPTGKSLVVTDVVIRVTAFTVGAKAVQATASFGANVTFDDYLNSVEYTVAAADVAIRDTVLDSAVPVYAAADVVSISIEVASDADVETWAVDLFGYLV